MLIPSKNVGCDSWIRTFPGRSELTPQLLIGVAKTVAFQVRSGGQVLVQGGHSSGSANVELHIVDRRVVVVCVFFWLGESSTQSFSCELSFRKVLMNGFTQ